ncbi:type II toxin-antitoxin system Phd/YefM family antitoxin [Candidatus Poriferisodalis sp.]|uniref:type II toxin-antitoxin system Phd/YefM family antitoxin n=1 Tax=Candidatus Poriferisodalis sp. TaxID=3101277 RepID=UPI003B020EA7
MSEVASRELRNNTRVLLDRVACGERITVTVNGRPVAELGPIGDRPRWMARGTFIRDVLTHQADAALSATLASLTDETTDELPWR